MTRDEHLEWCKARARAYIERNDPINAFGSMVSDLGKHEETAGHIGIELGMMMLMGGHLDTAQRMGQFIEGFS